MADDRFQRVREVVPQSREFIGEVVTELRKVHWPTRQETFAATAVVIVVVLFVSLWLGLIDGALSLIFTRILGTQ